MTLAQFIAAMIKCLSDFQSDWKETSKELNLYHKRTFADWLAIFKEYALRAENKEDDFPPF